MTDMQDSCSISMLLLFLPRDDTVKALVSVSDPANQPCADPPTTADARHGHQSGVPAPAYAPNQHNNKPH